MLEACGVNRRVWAAAMAALKRGEEIGGQGGDKGRGEEGGVVVSVRAQGMLGL